MGQRVSQRRGTKGHGPRAVLARAFRERQIYLRSEGDVRFITLGPWKQVGALFLLLLALFWFAYSSFNVVLSGQLFAGLDRSHRAKLDQEDRLAEMRDAVDRLSDKLLLDQTSYLDKVDEVRADYEKLVERHRILTDLLRRGQVSDAPEADLPVEKSGGRRDLLDDAAPAANRPSKGSLNELTFRQKYAQDFRTHLEAVQPLVDMRRRFAEFEELQMALLQDAGEESRGRAKEIVKLLKGIGLPKKSLASLTVPNQASVGGPFIAASLADLGSEEMSDRLEATIQSFAVEERLRSRMVELPLVLPLTGRVSVTSRFGLRRDPFRRVPALHSGIDLRADYGASVVATAPGEVVKAGWDGAYGRSVEIAHDNGISTVYAHLRSIKVKRGQRVAIGDVVGLLGSTGRSTGPHLHYETRIGGRSVDPARFWKVRHALQTLSE